jgi:hypothetical protein
VATVTVVVVASLGGERLRATLDSARWAPRVAVLDPTGRADLSSLPPGAAHWQVGDLPRQIGDDWWLLLAEGELSSDALRAAVLQATADGRARAYRLPLEFVAFGGTLRPRGGPVRLSRGGSVALGISAQGQLSVCIGEQAPYLGEAVRVPSGGTLIDGVFELDRDAAAWAALSTSEADVGTLRAARVGSASLLRTLVGRASGRLGWGRLVLAVLHGYRAVLTFGKCWETRRGPAT